MSISKLRDGLTQRPNLQMVFKFLVNRMKIEDFRKYGPIWPFGRCRPFWSTEFYELSMRDRRRVSDHNRRKFNFASKKLLTEQSKIDAEMNFGI